MISGVIFVVNVGLLLALLYWVKKRYGGARDENLARLEEVIRSAELTNSGFFRALELVQNNLQSLLARAEETERRLRSLMLQPGSDRKDQYAAAALLLGEGQQPEHVASVLKLPLAHVKTVQELRNLPCAEKRASTRRIPEEASASAEPRPQKKSAASREKIAPRRAASAGLGKKASNQAGLPHSHPRHIGVNA